MFLIITLFIFWSLLSGYIHLLPFIPGVVSLFLILYLYKRVIKRAPISYKFSIPIYKIPLYIVWLLKEIVVANYDMVRVILLNKYNPKIIEVENRFTTQSAKVIYANSITVTPGSMVIDSNDDRFVIHVVNSDFGSSITANTLEEKVKHLEKKGNL